MYRAWLYRYAVVVACCTLALLAAGGLVTDNGAGLAVASWPLVDEASRSAGGAGYQIAHRAAAAAVGLLMIGLAAALVALERRAWLRRLGVLTAVAVAGQGILGGLGVRWLLPEAVSVAHAVLASLIFAATVAIAVFTSRGWIEHSESVRGHRSPLRMLSLLAAGTIVVQIGFGAAVRHGVLGFVPHLAAGGLAGVLGLWAVWLALSRHMGHAALRRSALALLSLGISQALLGMGAYLGRAVTAQWSLAPPPLAVAFSVSHVAAGAGALAAAVALAVHVRRVLPAGTGEAA